jgi:class 3 adenylate cyclase
MGDATWRGLLDAHDKIVRVQLQAHNGRLVKHTGDGILARFGSADDALHCAIGLRSACRQLGLAIRCGVHAGTVELRDYNDVAGLDVHVAARIAALGRAEEILVSASARELANDSDIQYADRGTHRLRGLPGDWNLAAIRAADPDSR